MIKSFQHKGLRLYYETGSTKGIQGKHAEKLRMQLVALDTAFEFVDGNVYLLNYEDYH
jgi:toxin HigB-1